MVSRQRSKLNVRDSSSMLPLKCIVLSVLSLVHVSTGFLLSSRSTLRTGMPECSSLTHCMTLSKNKKNTAGEQNLNSKIRLENGRQKTVRARTVQLAPNGEWNVTVFEWEEMADTVTAFWNVQNANALTPAPQSNHNDLLDPFGLVSWPGSVVAAQELARYKDTIKNSTVLVVGAGPGVEAQAVAMLGAKQVIATDIHPTTLKLLELGAEAAGLDHIITTQVFDLLSDESLPQCDIMVVADVMYNEHLAQAGVGRRIKEALKQTNSPRILVSDSQRFHGTDFLPVLNHIFDDKLAWKERKLKGFTGSGVMIDEDQTYDVTVRTCAIGWESAEEQ